MANIKCQCCNIDNEAFPVRFGSNIYMCGVCGAKFTVETKNKMEPRYEEPETKSIYTTTGNSDIYNTSYYPRTSARGEQINKAMERANKAAKIVDNASRKLNEDVALYKEGKLSKAKLEKTKKWANKEYKTAEREFAKGKRGLTSNGWVIVIAMIIGFMISGVTGMIALGIIVAIVSM